MQKPTLLILPGALGAASQFDEFAKLLSANFDVYSMEYSGHGKNIREISSLSIELLSDEVLHYVNENQLQNCSIFGYSMGGYLALYLAAKHPNKLGKIMTLATKFNWTPAIAEAEVKFLNPEKTKEKVPAFANYLHQLHGNKWEQLMLHTAKLMLQLGTKNLLTEAFLKEVLNEVKITRGEFDKMVSQEETAHVAQSINKAHLEIFSQTPHPWEKVDYLMVANSLEKFILNK
ncbi:MAG TPA: alpha/beta fold hydrolase [Bacteroidia bacterium]|nr:alpha/beta fold hydrolase [Bacteroidia bacterium]